jgi:hypothetical protein
MALKFVNNYADWIKDEWIEHFLSVDGSCFPRDATAEEEPGMVDAAIRGEDPNSGVRIADGKEEWGTDWVCCITYKQHELPFKVEMPFDIPHEHEWFFMKLRPGMVQPVHQDYADYGKEYVDGVAMSNKNNVERYLIPLQDYKRGHLFLYDNKILKDYKKGDMFKHDGEDIWHGGGNMGHSTRLTFNLTVYPK